MMRVSRHTLGFDGLSSRTEVCVPFLSLPNTSLSTLRSSHSDILIQLLRRTLEDT